MSYRDETLVGEELTPRERQAVELGDQGKTDQEIATVFGLSNPGSAGNLRRRGLTKLGRGSEVRGGGAGRASAPRRAPAMVIDELDPTHALIDGYRRAKSTADALSERLHEATEDAGKTDEQRIANRTAELDVAVKDAQATLDAFTGMSEEDSAAWVEQQQRTATARLDAVKKEVEEPLAKVTANLEKFIALAETLEIDLSEVEEEQPSGDAETEESENGEEPDAETNDSDSDN